MGVYFWRLSPDVIHRLFYAVYSLHISDIKLREGYKERCQIDLNTSYFVNVTTYKINTKENQHQTTPTSNESINNIKLIRTNIQQK